jgi:acyl-CoA thioesterase
MVALPHPGDLELLGLDVDPEGGTARFTIGPGLVRHDGALYGGTGLAVSVAVMEAVTQRDALWATTQFVSQPMLGTEVVVTAERLAIGKKAAQVQVRATAGDDVVFVAVGSTGLPIEGGLTGQYVEMPRVAGPDDAVPWMRSAGMPQVEVGESWGTRVDMREAAVLDDDGPSVALWTRMRNGQPTTPAVLAFVSDMVPVGVARSAGKLGAGSSLDNSLRFHGGVTEAEWLLLELRGELARGGFGHGTVRVWTDDGRLVATGSQSASMRYLFSEGETPNLPG